MSPPLSVTFKMSTDEGQRGKQCNYKYLDPTVVLEKDKELELPLMNTSTKSSTAFFLWHIIKQINIIFKTHQNKQTKRISKRKNPQKTKPNNSSQTCTFESKRSEWNTTTSFHRVQIQKEKIDIKVRRTPSQCHNAMPLWGNLWRWDLSLPIHWHLIRL